MKTDKSQREIKKESQPYCKPSLSFWYNKKRKSKGNVFCKNKPKEAFLCTFTPSIPLYC